MQKNIKKYIDNSKNKVTKNFDNNYSFTIAAGINFNYNKNSGFSMKLLDINDIQNEEKKLKNKYINHNPKGSNINIYC